MTDSRPLAVITGAGRTGQVGEALAEAYATAGHAVALLDLDGDGAASIAGALRDAGHVATAHGVDLADAAAARNAADAVRRAHPHARGVHALVCAAGGFGLTGPLDESDPADWRKQYVISLETAYATTRAFLPALREASGSIVYFASAAALAGADTGALAAYAGAKRAVLALMESIAQAERAAGVRANAVAPTAIRTASNVDAMGEDGARWVERASVCDVVRFLTSEAARNVTGQVLRLS